MTIAAALAAPQEVICTRCMLWHLPPLCSHNADEPCLGCGQPRGYRWRDNNGQSHSPAWKCWYCASGRPRP